MTKFLLSIIGYWVLVGASILVMIFGYGLTVQSWGWVIGGSVVGSVIGALFQLAEN